MNNDHDFSAAAIRTVEVANFGEPGQLYS